MTKMDSRKDIESFLSLPSRKNTLVITLSICTVAILVSVGVYWWQTSRCKLNTRKLQWQINDLQGQINQLQLENLPENEEEKFISEDQENVLENGKQMGYIKSVYEEGEKKYLKIDYIQWLGGEEGAQACVEDKKCLPQCLEEGGCLPNGYYVRNQNTKIRTFEISDSTMFDFTDLQSAGFELDNIPLASFTISFVEFKDIFSSSDTEQEWLRNSIYNIELQNSVIIKLWHQYQP